MKTVIKHLTAAVASTASNSGVSCRPPASYTGDGTTTTFALPFQIPSIPSDFGGHTVTVNGVAKTQGTGAQQWDYSSDKRSLVFVTAPGNGLAVVITHLIVHRPYGFPDKKATVQIVILSGTYTNLDIVVQGQLEDGNVAWVDLVSIAEGDFTTLVAGGQYFATFDGMPNMRILYRNTTTSVAGTISAWIFA